MAITYLYYPAGPVYNDDGDVVGTNKGITKWDIIGLVLFSLVTRVTYGMLKGCIEMGTKPTYCLDLFVINLTSQTLLSFTSYGWYVYLLVPGYICYILSGYFWSYISNAGKAGEPEQAMDPKMAKKLEKQKKKEEKPRVKYLKH